MKSRRSFDRSAVHSKPSNPIARRRHLEEMAAWKSHCHPDPAFQMGWQGMVSAAMTSLQQFLRGNRKWLRVQLIGGSDLLVFYSDDGHNEPGLFSEDVYKEERLAAHIWKMLLQGSIFLKGSHAGQGKGLCWREAEYCLSRVEFDFLFERWHSNLFRTNEHAKAFRRWSS